MVRKRILLFAPYGAWLVHHQVDAVLGAALQVRGCEVVAVLCNGIFEDCPLNKGLADNALCQSCSKAGEQLFSSFDIPVLQMRSLIHENDIEDCKTWAASVRVENISTAVFEEQDIGKWVSAGVHSYFMAGHLDFSREEVVKINKSFLYNGALLSRVYDKILDKFRPDHVFCFHSMLAYYRIALELSTRKGIRAIVHDRAFIDDSFQFLADENIHGIRGRTMAWKPWRDIPLTSHECFELKQYLLDRETGKNTNFTPFYQFISDDEKCRKALRIPGDAKIVALFGSSDWENGIKKWDVPSAFASQIDGMKRIINLFRDRNEYLVIRHHPHPLGVNNTDTSFLEAAFELNRELPENVRVIMPTEKLTSYSILWNAEAVITFGSTIGIESISRGISTCSCLNNIYTALEIGINRVKIPLDSVCAIDRVIKKGANLSVNDVRSLYRGAYFLFFRLSFKFKSFGIRNKFSPDIRIESTNELSEENDRTLDHICNHILHHTPLYPVPCEAEKQRSDKEETEFLEKEVEEIKKKRAQVRKYAILNKNYTESLITVIRIRQDGIRDPQDTVFSRTVKRSRHKNIELLHNFEMAFPYSSDTAMFLQELSASVIRAKGEFVYFGTDNTHVDESLFSTAIDFLIEPENSNYDGIITGAWICDKKGKLTDEIFTEQKNINDYQTALNILPLIKNPAQLLTFFVWRKSSLLRFVSGLEKSKVLPDDISSVLYEKVFSQNTELHLYKTLSPMITIYTPLAAKELISQGIVLFNGGKLEDALGLFEKAKDSGEQVQSLDYYRALTTARLGKLWEARVIAEAQIVKKPSDEQTKNLLLEIYQGLEGKDLQYADIASSVESVEGWLASGQEKYLFDKVRSLSDEAVVLEIGSCYGRSAVAMAFGCVGTGRRIFSIDTFLGNVDGGTIKQGNTFFDLWHRNIHRLGLEKYITPLSGFSHEQIEKWGDKLRLDFVFIDGSHHYVDVIKDFELVYPLVKDDGWIAFHDVEPAWPGSWRLWRETAMKILSSHEYCLTLASGRKQSGMKVTRPSDVNAFSYALEWAKSLAQAAPQLSNAMLLCMRQSADSLVEEQAIDSAERTIATMPEPVSRTLRIMLFKEACNDPYLHFWNALVLERQGEDPLSELHEGIRVSRPETPERIIWHLHRLGGQISDAGYHDDASALNAKKQAMVYSSKDEALYEKRDKLEDCLPNEESKATTELARQSSWQSWFPPKDRVEELIIEFLEIYNKRPIQNNEGGVKSVGAFSLWFFLRRTRPNLIIESGVWKGFTTWLIENAVPDADIICLDPNPVVREFTSKRADYLSLDFKDIDFKEYDLSNAMVFFDDHQNAYERVLQAWGKGFNHLIFDDNYPGETGSHLSLQTCLSSRKDKTARLQEIIEKYEIFPPLYEYNKPITMEKVFIDIPALNIADIPAFEMLKQEMHTYRWLTYVKLVEQNGIENTRQFVAKALDTQIEHADALKNFGQMKGKLQLEAHPQSIPKTPGSSHYDRKYFDWQKEIGKFGGRANLFKFSNYISPRDCVVDFGCGGGYLLQNLICRERLGIEINPYARDKAAKNGITAVGSVAEIPDVYADIIISNHALEHVANPVETLRSLNDKLRYGGKIVFVVPHQNIREGYNPNDVNHHLYTWNRQTIGNLFSHAGYDIVTIDPIQHQWPPNYMQIFREMGEDKFHSLSIEYAKRNNNYQIRIVARKPEKKYQFLSSCCSHRKDETPVILMTYNRPQHAKQVLDALKAHNRKKLFIFSDGPKNDFDLEKVEETRNLFKRIDWCESEIIEKEKNIGLAMSIVGAVNHVFKDHHRMILLEDDCVPQKYFFDFIEAGLDKYENNERIFGISGYTVPIPEAILKHYPYDLYFFPRIGSWGWATWKRAWQNFEPDLTKAYEKAVEKNIDIAQGGNDIPLMLHSMLAERLKDVWTLHWVLSVYLNKGYYIYPTCSHIENIGLDGSGVHCGATQKFVTPMADKNPSQYPDEISIDESIYRNFRRYYDLRPTRICS